MVAIEPQPTMAKEPKAAKAKRPRGTGSLYKQPGSKIWWVQFSHHGQRFRESTGTDNQRKAVSYLREKLGEVSLGTYTPNASRVTVTELVEAKLTSDKNNARKDVKTSEGRWNLHLKDALGHVKARNLSSAFLGRYVERRLAEGAPNGTVNRELALVRASFHAARRQGLLRSVPFFPMLKEPPARQGFLRDDQYEKLAEACAAEGLWLRSMFEVAYSYGWRRRTLIGLKVWQIDFPAKTIRLYDTKNGSGLPMVMTEKVKELLTACCEGKGQDDYVFTRDGSPIVEYRKAWERARKAAGCPDLLLHDLCRTGMRNMRRLGVSEGVAMKVAGRKTASIFRRYDIVDESDLREVARKLDEKQQGQFSHSPAIVQPQGGVSEESTRVEVVLAQ